jgi:hypothetical protein
MLGNKHSHRRVYDLKLNKSELRLIDSDKPKLVPVIICTWMRVEGFNKVVEALNKQTNKNFKLFIWNNNSDITEDILDILTKKASFSSEIFESDFNIGGFGRFYFANHLYGNPELSRYCIFIDDDQTFEEDTIEKFLKEALPKTILSQWSWKFNSTRYFGRENRILVDPHEEVHHCGTGGMVADMEIFMEKGLYECPKKYWFIEDLWLSYFSSHKKGYKLLKSSTVFKNGSDKYNLNDIVKDQKETMLAELIEDLGWSILKNN